MLDRPMSERLIADDGDAAMTRRRSRPAARPPGASETRSGRRPIARGAAAPLHQALGPLHLGEHPHRPRPQLLDRRRLRALPARARRRGAVRVRLRRLRPARRARRDRRRRVSQRVGEPLRRAHDRAARSPRLLLRLGAHVPQLATRSCTAGRSGCSSTLLEAGLVYRGSGNVDWCDTCQTTLATIQVEDGLCWRCHNPVRLIQRPQWIPAHQRIRARRTTRRLDELENWDENSLASQRFVLGRVDGVELDLPALGRRTLTVFTPHADALELARFVLISPKHPDVDRWADDPQVRERLEELRSGGLERSSRDAEAIPLIDTGHSLSARGRRSLPVLISPVVDGRFGATAVLGIPERDHTDAMIAERLGTAHPPSTGPTRRRGGRAAAGPHAAPRGLVQPCAIGPMTSRSRASARGARRSRSSTARPAARCRWPPSSCPVLLPLDITPDRNRQPAGRVARSSSRRPARAATGPRAARPTRSTATSTRCGCGCRPACRRRRAARPLEDILALADLRHWLPCERVVAGSDSGNFVFDQRIVTKALRDIGPLAFLADGEPFAGCLFHEMVISDGRKMSKHLGNVVDPDALVERYGADTVRLAVLYAARPQRSLNWSDSAVLRCHRFLTQVWEYSTRLQARRRRDAAPTERGRDEPAGETMASRSETRPSTSGCELRLAMVRDCRGEDHRGDGESRDAQRRAQRHAPVRSDQGLREARGRAPGRAQPRPTSTR